MPILLKLFKKNHQSGAALITAMLLAALITILAASWLARFDSQLRTVEMQRTGTQTRWLLRAATHWARVILAEHANSAFHLGEPWAVPIASTRIADISGTQEAYFSGYITDAQSRFNLHNWRVIASKTNPVNVPLQLADHNEKIHIEWGKRIMQGCGLSPAQIEAWYSAIQYDARIIDSEKMLFKKDTVLVLDTLPFSVSDSIESCLNARLVWLSNGGNSTVTTININTVDTAVLAAHPYIGQTEAQRLLTARKAVSYIKDVNNIQNSLGISNEVFISLLTQQFDIKSQYFLATGRVTMGRIDIMASSLLYLEQYGVAPAIVWTKSL
jgi:type II secretory pathway component PulK